MLNKVAYTIIQLVKKVKFCANGDAEFGCVYDDDEEESYFNTIDLCTDLGSETKANGANVEDACASGRQDEFSNVSLTAPGLWKSKLDGSLGDVIFVNESGLYSPVFGS